jgi:hypothetical protein
MVGYRVKVALEHVDGTWVGCGWHVVAAFALVGGPAEGLGGVLCVHVGWKANDRVPVLSTITRNEGGRTGFLVRLGKDRR